MRNSPADQQPASAGGVLEPIWVVVLPFNPDASTTTKVASGSNRTISQRISRHPHHFFVGSTLLSCLDQRLNSRIGAEILLREKQLDVSQISRYRTIRRAPGLTNKKTPRDLLIQLLEQPWQHLLLLIRNEDGEGQR